MGESLTKTLIRVLLTKLGPERFSVIGDDAGHNDHVFVRIWGAVEDNPGQPCVVRSVEGKSLKCSYRVEDDEKWIKIPISDFDSHDKEIEHYYKYWHIKYDTLLEACFHVVLGINRIKWLLQSQYDKSLQRYTDHITLLKLLVDLREPASDDVDFGALLTKVYGPRIRTSPQELPYRESLRFLLLTLQDSGDITLTDQITSVSNIKVKPKALRTVNEHLVEQRRHSDVLRITRWQLVVAVCLVLLTAANVWLAYSTFNARAVVAEPHNKAMESDA